VIAVATSRTLVTMRCPTPACARILAERYEPWRGDPLYILCKNCQQLIEVGKTVKPAIQRVT
jgi:hypothetical protein